MLSEAIISITAPTSPGTQTYTCTDQNSATFQPTVLIFQGTENTANGTATGAALSFGIAISTTNQVSFCPTAKNSRPPTAMMLRRSEAASRFSIHRLSQSSLRPKSAQFPHEGSPVLAVAQWHVDKRRFIALVRCGFDAPKRIVKIGFFRAAASRDQEHNGRQGE
jgi:hypothetical protein